MCLTLGSYEIMLILIAPVMLEIMPAICASQVVDRRVLYLHAIFLCLCMHACMLPFDLVFGTYLLDKPSVHLQKANFVIWPMAMLSA